MPNIVLNGLIENKTTAILKGIVNVVEQENKLVGRFGTL